VPAEVQIGEAQEEIGSEVNEASEMCESERGLPARLPAARGREQSEERGGIECDGVWRSGGGSGSGR
jgi:hypothetical protein